MAASDFDTKVAVAVRYDLEAWQRVNVTAFLISGVVAAAGAEAIGEDYLDADGNRYLPLLVQPVIVLEAGAEKLKTVRERAQRRNVPIALYTWEMFTTARHGQSRGGSGGGLGRPRHRGDRVARAASRRRRGAAGTESPPLASVPR